MRVAGGGRGESRQVLRTCPPPCGADEAVGRGGKGEGRDERGYESVEKEEKEGRIE